jgi:hypothetical protein
MKIFIRILEVYGVALKNMWLEMTLLVIILMFVVLLKLSFLGSMTLLFIDYGIILVLNNMVLNLNVGFRHWVLSVSGLLL